VDQGALAGSQRSLSGNWGIRIKSIASQRRSFRPGLWAIEVRKRGTQTDIGNAAEQLAEADSAGARIGWSALPAGVGYRGVELATPPSRREACLGRRRGLECG